MLAGRTRLASQPAALSTPNHARLTLYSRCVFRTGVSAQQQRWQQLAVHAAAADDLLADIDWTEDMPGPVKRRVAALRELQSEWDALKAAYIAERAELDAKYEQKHAPLYDKRVAVASGTAPVGVYDIPDSDEPDNGIPDFWLMALTNHDVVGEFITERDSEVLGALRDIRVTSLTGQDAGSFKLSFHFGKNDFFENEVLEKTFFMQDPIEFVPSKFVGTEIRWYPEKDVTVEVVQQRVKPRKGAKGPKAAPSVTTTRPCASFFNFFKTPVVPEDPNDLDDESLEELQEKMDEEYEVACAFKDYIVPRAVEWFTGEAAPPMLGDDYGEGDYDDFEEEEEAPAPQKRR